MEKVQALKAKAGKRQHMDAGKVYAVSEETAQALIKGGKAVKAKDDAKVGEVYELETKAEGPTDDDLLGSPSKSKKSKRNRK
jgi:hypothetical protein